MEDSKPVPEEVTPLKPSPAARAMKFFREERKTIIACTVTGAVVFAATRAGYVSKLETLEFNRRCLSAEYNELDLEFGTVMEFIDHKNLREKYFDFARQMVVDIV